MKNEINYVILAHKNPAQVNRLIEKLTGDNCYFYIHVDKNVDIEPFKTTLSRKPQVHFVLNEEREYGTWGDFGIVKATINALRTIVRNKKSGYVVLLSGQDYPIKSNGYIKSFLSDNYGTNFINLYRMPYENWRPEGGMERILRYKLNKSHMRGDFTLLPSIWEGSFYDEKVLRNISWLIRHGDYKFFPKIIKKRNFPLYLKPYGGEQWWALPIETITEILAFLDRHEDYVDYHIDTLLPDEIFFHSIIMGLFDKKIGIFNYTLTYMNWTKGNAGSPATFTSKDFEELQLQSYKLFARKFDIEIDDHILDLIDSAREGSR
jgi:hypothetical protein